MYLLDEWRNHSHGNNRSRRLEPLAQLGEPGRYLGAPSSRPRPPHAAPPGPAAVIPAERTQPRAGEPASSAAAGVTTAAIRDAAAPSHVSPTFPSAIARGEGPGGGGRGRGANKSVRAGRGLPKSPPRGPARPRKFARCPPLIEETADYSIRTRVSRPGLSALPCPCPEGLRARVSGGECLPAWPLPSPRLPLPPPPARLFTEELLPAVPRLALFLCPPD
ncbi:vegetative cell wall protein gp1-like [Schistocerca americana]|uniref:vegetative cell wall protein gp1-like n=1 Tax=Schistocerca americana TaxID=7009 RepID=UPI001F503049|nr:vegetative cell wall protein gp1-like [Schistocerca americana]